MKRISLFLALLIAACSPHQGTAPDLQVANAWAREAGAGKTVSAAYLVIANNGGTDDALVSITSSTGPAALHSTSMVGGIMRMRMLDRLPIAAGASIELKPGGTHVMLTGLTAPLPAGSTVDLTLRFEKSAEQRVTAAVHAASGDQK